MDAVTLGENLRQARNLGAFCRVVASAVSSLGFDEFIFSSSSGFAFENLTPAGARFFRKYRDRGMIEMDPVVAQCAASRYPVHWDAEAYLRSATSDQLQTFWEETRLAGFASGFSVPVYGPGGQSTSFVCISHDRTRAHSRDLYRLADGALVIGTMVTAVVHENFHAARQPQCRLTGRERECLYLTARGRTAPEIAGLLGISVRTTHFHLQNAMAKLDCGSKYQAAIEAMRRGLLSAQPLVAEAAEQPPRGSRGAPRSRNRV